ncbi:MAG: phosphoribosylformylglycinamidine synthase I [Desulfatiglans sp.]|nr:phosphoribosylformylglycinamidine synthase I [Desulfatiglans sp.]
MMAVKAIILTGYGLNCDNETEYALRLAGAEPLRMHINDLIDNSGKILDEYQILVFGGGFSWADDHGAGVIFATKIKYNIGDRINSFIEKGNLVIGICNGFQSLVNLGLLPGFDNNYAERRVALTNNDRGNFIDCWVNLKVNPASNCVFTKGIDTIELPVRHGEGKLFASEKDIERLFKDNQVVMQYADNAGKPAKGSWPLNPNGSTRDIAGICDPTGRIFGLMPHPEAFNSYMNHPDWTRKKETLSRAGKSIENSEGEGIKIFRNAVQYIQNR